METDDGTVGKAGETRMQAPGQMQGQEPGPAQGRGQGPSQAPVPPPPGSWGYPQAPQPPYWAWYGQPAAQYPAPERRRSGKPKIVGILLMFSGVLSILMGVILGAVVFNVVPWAEQMQSSAGGTGEIDGQIIYMNSTPAPDVNISIPDLGLAGATNETGQYRLLSVKAGWHDLKIERAGFKTWVKSVYVTATGDLNTNIRPTKADFQLQPGDGEFRLGDAHTPGSTAIPMDATARSILNSIGTFCMTAGVVMGALAILGGYYAMRTEKLGMVALGTLCGILSFGFAIGAGLSFIALILLLLSTDEFERTRKEREARP
jgi:hypothetical protein